MEDLFGQIECRSKSDLIVMRILRSAMDKAHEKLQYSKDGPIKFLHERSTFYELAAILVEGGLSIVQEETYVLEGSSDKILSDLTEIRHWLQGRIQDMKQLIVQKDMELSERLANECKLREALELKERELGCLHETKIEPERMKNDENEATDEGDISRLKNSVDQQVFNIKQKLEDEKKILTTERRTRKSRRSSPNISFDFLDKEINDTCLGIERFKSDAKPMSDLPRPNDQNVLIRRMSSDIDILKETLDLAFGRMHSVEVLPLEKQWRWTVEKDIESILVKGFITDLRGIFDAELKNRVGFLKDSWSEFVEEMIKDFFTRNDSGIEACSSTCSMVKRRVSEPLPDLSYGETLVEDSRTNDKNNHVVEIIKNHESLIRKHHQEWSWLTREVIERERSSKRDNDDTTPERRVHEEEMTIPEPETDRSIESLEVEIEGLKEERDMLCLQITVMEDFYELLFRGLLKDIESGQNKNNTCCSCDTELDISGSCPIPVHYLESTIREDLYVIFFRETAKQWKEKQRKIESDHIKNCDSILQESLGSLLREEIYMVSFTEMAEAWKTEKDAFAIEGLIRDDVYQFVINEAVKDSHLQLKELEFALYQLYTSKELLVHQLYTSKELLVLELEQRLQVLGNMEHMLHENLDAKCLRLDVLKREVDTLAKPLAVMRTRKLLYKNAFISRCHNLRLAETEVDLLGDQVESLLSLLERIYYQLNQNANVLSNYFEVYDMLKLIRRELNNGGRSCKSKS